MTQSNKGRWYIKFGEQVQGPFPNKLIGSYLILGRIKQSTLVSRDKENWSPVSDYPAMVPEVVKEAGTTQGDRALMLARIREDERSSDAKHDEMDFENRREDEEQLMQLHRQIRDDVLKGYRRKPHKLTIFIVLSMLFILILVALVINKSTDNTDQSDCEAIAGPGINWSSCRKQGVNLAGRDLQGVNFNNANLQRANFSNSQLQKANLAYANLSAATLTSAQLQKVNLKGANLRQANLQNADLFAADLSYAELVGSRLQGANLKQAIFDYAIWVNGETCLPGSVGACLLPAAK